MNRQAWILIFTALFLLNFGSTKGQVFSTQGWFEADFSQGCLPLTVTVRTSIPDADVPIFQFEGQDDTNLFPWNSSLPGISYTYSNAGSFMIYLTIQSLNVNRQDSLQITVLDSQIPNFELRNCEGNGLVVEILDNFYDSFEVDFGDGTVTTVNAGDANPSHFYTDTQTYTVNVTGQLSNAPNNCLSSSTSFTPAPTVIAPSLDQVIVADSGQVELMFTLPQNLEYNLEIAAGSSSNFQFNQILRQGSGLVILSNLTPESDQYCFRITVLDPCLGNTIISNINCSLSTQLTIVNNENQLAWQTISQGNEMYRIARNTIPNFITFPSTVFNHNDQQVVCGIEYCYQITIIYPDGSISTSSTKCGTAFSTDTPPNIDDISVDIATLGVQIGWEDLPSLEESYVTVQNPGGGFIVQDSTDLNPLFFEIDLDEYPQTCYRHAYLDICGNVSNLGPPICSVLLSGISNPDGSIALNWTEFEGWSTEGVENYILEKYSPDGTLLESQDLQLATDFLDAVDGSDQLVSYRVIANPINSALIPARSNQLDIARRAQLHFPSAFTPDGDGLNDTFLPGDILFINTYLLQVYDRWGGLIFSTKNKDVGWDGTISGKLAPEGNYTYVAHTEDFRGLKISRTGVVLLLTN